MTLIELERAAKEKQNELKNLRLAIDDKKAQTLVKCETNYAYVGKGCGMASEIRELTYIATHWYESPHGCTGGDIWHEGEGMFNCPHCGYRNRLYERQEIQELRRLFKNIIDEFRD